MLKASATTPYLLLASSSKYRAELLARLRIPFAVLAPDIDETAHTGESAETLVQRLAVAKARKLDDGSRWVLGSDQAAECEGLILGKPGSHERAVEQLEFVSGKAVRFYTAVVVARGDRLLQALDLTTVHFRPLTRDAIERYLAAEPAYDCAGSFKCEGLGISLFESIESHDPTALVGLPLIALSRLLRDAGFELPIAQK